MGKKGANRGKKDVGHKREIRKSEKRLSGRRFDAEAKKPFVFLGQTNATVRLDGLGAAKRGKGLFDEIAVDVVRNVFFGKGSMPKTFVGVFVAVTRRRRARLHLKFIDELLTIVESDVAAYFIDGEVGFNEDSLAFRDAEII